MYMVQFHRLLPILLCVLALGDAASHRIVYGNPTFWTFSSNVNDEPQCVDDTDKQNDDGNDIAVQCCSTSGSSAFRTGFDSPDGCLSGLTYDEATARCSEKGARLCSFQEVASGIGTGTGCGFDNRHLWTSDACTAPPVHFIAVGSQIFLVEKGIECASNLETQGIASSTAYGRDIGVQCCSIDGSSASRPGCLQSVTFDVAKAKCKETGGRLCTLEEVNSGIGVGTGCNHDARHVWTATPCEGHMIKVGSSVWETDASGDKKVECRKDSEITGLQSNSYGNDIAVQCCSKDGSSGFRTGFDTSDCLSGITYNEAKSQCIAKGGRLCSVEEVANGIGQGTGCSHDARHVWTSDQCYVEPDIDPEHDAEDGTCTAAYGRGVGTFPIGCADHVPVDDAGLCYESCRSGFYGVGPLCYERCDSNEVDDGLFCRIPLITVAKDSYGRGVGVIPTGCKTGDENDAGLCYPLCRDGYYGVLSVCWERCRSGYDDHGASCYYNLWTWYFKNTYGRGVGTVPSYCPSDKPDKELGLCYSQCRNGYYGVLTVCWERCDADAIDVGALCEVQSLSIRAKESYGRGAGVLPAKCEDGEENDAGLCYPLCRDGYHGVGPVCWSDVISLILEEGWEVTTLMSSCGLGVVGAVMANQESGLLSADDLDLIKTCISSISRAMEEFDPSWTAERQVLAVEFGVSASVIGSIAFDYGVAFHVDDYGVVTQYYYDQFCYGLNTDISVDAAASLVLYRSLEDIPGHDTYFSYSGGAGIGQATTFSINGDCVPTGVVVSFSVSVGLMPVSFGFGECSATELRDFLVLDGGGRRRTADDALLLSSEKNDCFEKIDSNYYAQCTSLKRHQNELSKIQKVCAASLDCVGYTLEKESNIAQLIRLSDCSRNGIRPFDDEFYLNRCLSKRKSVELKKGSNPVMIKKTRAIHRYDAKCPFDVEVKVRLKERKNGTAEWYNIFSFDANGNVPYPRLLVNFNKENYKLQIGKANECESSPNTLSTERDDIFSISIQCEKKTVLKLNGDVLCMVNGYNFNDLKEFDGKAVEVFGFGGTYLSSVSATTPKYLWNAGGGYLKDMVFNTEPNLEYFIRPNTLIAPYLDLQIPYSIKFDIKVDSDRIIKNVKYNIFEIGIENDLSTELNDVYLDFLSIYDTSGLILKVSTPNDETTTKKCSSRKSVHDFKINDWNEINIQFQTSKVILFLNDIEQCRIDAKMNIRETAPLLFAVSSRINAIGGKFKNIQIVDTVSPRQRISPQRVSPARVSPHHVSPKKVSPQQHISYEYGSRPQYVSTWSLFGLLVIGFVLLIYNIACGYRIVKEEEVNL